MYHTNYHLISIKPRLKAPILWDSLVLPQTLLNFSEGSEIFTLCLQKDLKPEEARLICEKEIKN